ncbi:DNA repair protein RecN [Desulfolutivibrio sulfoxidireducens]|uniref:DNA repair protein RecN n=1 Tax=Desulfolutivibrio sulfoxidireducens TaxID=2773299 RepID=UPI00159D9FC5|nr:AAA family ATPase [Desulfolutivibrio sulfoxidireducens]QLA19395.1 AAA family ATPase [Desulfolutivibrio sulfoxidireducens]
MIELLRIKDLALIEDMELEFAPGLNALTGETGAGKSFIVSALNFLTGEKMPPDLVRPGAEKAVVEALFYLDGEEYVLRRELAAGTGRGRVSINDRLASQDALRDLRPRLLLHVGQHGQQKLLQPAFQAALLDAFLDPDASHLPAGKNALLRDLAALAGRITALEDRVRDLTARRELLEYQRGEIGRVAPVRGEEDDLLARKAALAYSKKGREAVGRALDLLAAETGAVRILADLEREVGAVAAAFPEFAADRETVASARHTLRDLAQRLRATPLAASPDDDPDVIEARLFELAQLKRKLKKSLDEIVDLNAEIETNLSFLDVCGLDMATLRREEKTLCEKLSHTLSALATARREAANRLAGRLKSELAGLGFAPQLDILFDFTPAPVYAAPHLEAPLTEDRARILWKPNPGQPPQPLDKIASGGELSRFLLAVTSLRAESEQPTLIFDEVDAGIGGLTLGSVADRLVDLAKSSQIILISHWPQLAARAERHFRVHKETTDTATSTRCARLSPAQVADELARMAGGGDKGQALAQHLLLE